jgi:CRP/FNR family cyclic AMP-dependent transcriptional regulator
MDVQGIASVLGRVDVFKALGEGTVEEISTRVRQRAIPKGKIIYAQGRPSHHLFVVAEGVVELVGRHKGVPIELGQYYRPPEMFGEEAVTDGAPRRASAKVVEEATLLLISSSVIDLVLSNPKARELLMRFLVGTVRHTTQRATDLMLFRDGGR